ncbi:MAG: lytic murein transglycosylase B [Gammaproteobacteria bacterium]
MLKVFGNFFITILFFLISSGIHGAELNQIEQKKFIQEMVDEHGFDKQDLERTFTKVKLLDYALEVIQKPAEKSKEWHEYRKIFLTKERIKKGVVFWQENRDLLMDVEKEYGVPREMIVAIIGVETYYGKFKGKYRVIDSLATLAFNYPKRAKFFRNELKQFLLFTRRLKMDPFSRMGSYAGAMGMPQFMPSSFQAYAVDFDHDDQINIWDNKADIFGSIANYFKRHGWKTDEPVAVPTWVKKNVTLENYIEKGLKPTIPLDELTKSGVETKRNIEGNPTSSLLEYKQENSMDYWVIFQNFYTITRYNHSPLYGMAVYQLSEEIKEAYVQSALIK